MNDSTILGNTTAADQPAFSLFRVVLSICAYGLFYFAQSAFIFFIPIVIILSPWPRLLYSVLSTIYRSFLFFLTQKMLPFFRIYSITEECGFDTIPQNAPAIFVANHRSKLDGPLLLAKLPRTGVIMKARYAAAPLFSTFVRHFDFISINPESIDSLSIAINRCKSLLAQGKRILIFPEGTRSRNARMQPFKDLAFKLSSQTNTPVIPVIVHSDLPLMAKVERSTFPSRTLKVRLRALAPLYIESNESISEFAERTRKLMSAQIKLLDHGTAWERLK